MNVTQPPDDPARPSRADAITGAWLWFLLGLASGLLLAYAVMRTR